MAVFCLFLTGNLSASTDQVNQYLRFARDYLKAKNDAAAKNFYEKALGLDPDDPAVKEFGIQLDEFIAKKIEENFKAAESLFEQKNYEEALKKYKVVLEYQPDNKNVRMKIREIETSQNQIQQYRDHGIVVSNYVRDGDGAQISAEYHYINALKAFKKSHYAEALGHIDKALERDKKHQKALALRNQIYTAQKRIDLLSLKKDMDPKKIFEYLLDFDKAVKEHPDDFEKWFERGRALVIAQRPTEAISDFQQAVEILNAKRGITNQKLLDTMNSRNAGIKPKNYLRQDLLQEKLEEFDKPIKDFPREFIYVLDKADFLRDLGRYSEAISHYEIALKTTNGLAAEVLSALSDAYILVGEPAKAYAASTDPRTGESCRSWFFRFSCEVRYFPGAYFVCLICMVFCYYSFIWSWRHLDCLFARQSLTYYVKLLRCLFKCIVSGPQTQVEEIGRYTKEMKLAWFHYVYGLLMINSGELKKAQEHLQMSLSSPGLEPKAYYFLGVIRRSLQQPLYQYDFEQSVMINLAGSPPSWAPKFLTTMEKDLLKKFTTTGTHDGMDFLANRIMKNLFGFVGE